MKIDKLLKEVVDDEAISDLHLSVNSKPIIRYSGKIKILERYEKKFSPKELEEIAKYFTNEEQWEKLQEKGEIDFSYSIPGFSRFRVNAYYQRGAISLALRVIPKNIPTIDELNHPDILKKLALQRMGLVLCTGPTGSGKSTTLAAMIDEMNRKKRRHVITLEDPIEYLHEHQKCIIHQREVGLDTKTFADGLRASLRQDPDVILVGEMRDLDTISIALQAAETGHLVLATLHTNDASKTIDRIIDVFPGDHQDQVRVQLASTLKGVISQQLLPRADEDGRVAALEVLIGTSAVKNIIRDGKSHQLKSVMQTGSKYGMIVMDNYLIDLYQDGLIDRQTILRRANNRDYVKKRLNNYN